MAKRRVMARTTASGTPGLRQRLSLMAACHRPLKKKPPNIMTRP